MVGVGWAKSGGEASGTLLENTIYVDGIQNVIKVLEEVELGKMEDLDFLEAMACVGGCVGGPLTVENNLWLSKELRNSQKMAEKQKQCGKEPAEDEYQKKYDLGLERVRWEKPLERSDAMELSSDIAQH